MTRKTIFVVDDVLLNVKLLSVLLRREGFTVYTAGDGAEALGILLTLDADLILADIQMPVMDGLELARRLKQDNRLRNIPVVALTSFGRDTTELQARSAGFDGYMTKPIDTGTIVERLRGYLEAYTGCCRPEVHGQSDEKP
jgi:CheY-like chemotaxis protein